MSNDAALCVGIDAYPGGAALAGCVADARAFSAMIARHADGEPNFAPTLLTSDQAPVTRQALRRAVRELFGNDTIDVALFYFAGHGIRLDDHGGYLVTQDFGEDDEGIAMTEVVALANASKARERIIVLDCCHAGALNEGAGGVIALALGGSLLMSSGSSQVSIENGGRGRFTSLVCDALDGAAADVQGYVTIGDVYNYLNQVLGVTEQRPQLHANLMAMRPLRRAKPTIPNDELRQLIRLFADEDAKFPLSPAYSESLGGTDEALLADFRRLQAMVSARLVVPIDAGHMWYAARDSKSCGLTPLGQMYWRKVQRGKI